jgi:GrpB-like predicted nucleotidyltransferase (UPF0157 family)
VEGIALWEILYPGAVAETTVVFPYDPEWATLFETENAALTATLAPWLDGGVHHVGSTAVPGLASKPIIDIIAGVRDLQAARAAFEPLRTLGYVHREHRPEAHAFAKPGQGDWWEQTHRLHLAEPGSDIWRERLAFREALRADPTLRAEYERWKFTHATTIGQPNPYTANKTAFITQVLGRSGMEVKPDRDRLTSAAWSQLQP